VAAKRKKTGGRKKGTPNRVTANAKAALEFAFDAVGGPKALAAWGRKNRTEFYKLWAKTIPRETRAEHTGAGGQPIEVTHEHRATTPAPAVLAAVLRELGLPVPGDVPPDGPGQPVGEEGAGAVQGRG
jgi:hypothetical protein